ncbi:TPA: hypothetical protein HA231_00295 [Candidatus Woesearchaeota archaeon]|nr:hypothetical protein [Candidatus Woesearchaeota archaeon]
MNLRFRSLGRLAANLAITGTVVLAAMPFAGQVASQPLEQLLSSGSSSRQFITSNKLVSGRAVESIEAVVENPGGVMCSKGFGVVRAAIKGTSLAYDAYLVISSNPNPEISELSMQPVGNVEHFGSYYGPGAGTYFSIRPGTLKPGEHFATVFAKRKEDGNPGLMKASVPLVVKSCLPDRPADVLFGNGYVLEKKLDGVELVAFDTSGRSKVMVADVVVYAGSRQVYASKLLFVNRLVVDSSYYPQALVPSKTIEVLIGETRLSANM